MATLYDIDERIRSLIDEETGEIKDYAEFENLQMERDEKIESVALWIKDLKAEAKAIDDEIKNLASRSDAAKKKVDKLKKYLLAALDGGRFKSSKVLVSCAKSQAVEVDDLFTIPEQYLKYKDPDVDKVRLAKVLKSGEAVPGCHLEERENVRVR